jgi:hypothetical protein
MTTERTFLSLSETATRWGISNDSVWRAAKNGHLRTIYLLGRRVVPMAEVERVEQHGLGPARKRWTKKAAC